MEENLIDESLKQYIEGEIVPRYRGFDMAHREDHVRTVILQALALSEFYPQLDRNMVYAAAAFHDTGLVEGRESHHLASGKIIRADGRLREWFDEEQIETIAQAAEDHRASSKSAPRSLYGRIIAEADRVIDPLTIIRRTVQFGLSNYPELDREGHFRRAVAHLAEKYGEGGYLKLWIPESPNVERLNELRDIIRDKDAIRQYFDRVWQVIFR